MTCKRSNIIFAVSTAIIFQLMIAVGLLLIVYQEPYGLMHVATNGAEVLKKLSSYHGNTVPLPSGIESLLASYHVTFNQLGRLLVTSSVAIMIFSLIQIVGVLFIWKRGVSDKASVETG